MSQRCFEAESESRFPFPPFPTGRNPGLMLQALMTVDAMRDSLREYNLGTLTKHNSSAQVGNRSRYRWYRSHGGVVRWWHLAALPVTPFFLARLFNIAHRFGTALNSNCLVRLLTVLTTNCSISTQSFWAFQSRSLPLSLSLFLSFFVRPPKLLKASA